MAGTSAGLKMGGEQVRLVQMKAAETFRLGIGRRDWAGGRRGLGQGPTIRGVCSWTDIGGPARNRARAAGSDLAADDGEVQRFVGDFEVGEQRTGGGQAEDDRVGGDVTHGAVGDLFVGVVGGDVEKQVGGADHVDIFVALRVGRVGAIGGGFGAVETGAVVIFLHGNWRR